MEESISNLTSRAKAEGGFIRKFDKACRANAQALSRLDWDLG